MVVGPQQFIGRVFEQYLIPHQNILQITFSEMEISEEIQVEGCNFFRQHIVFSLLSGRPISITKMRAHENEAGIRDFERKFLSMIKGLTNGTDTQIGRAGTQVSLRPGAIMGGEYEVDCGTSRSISYFLEPLIFVAPFCKKPLSVRLKGVTNAPDELSVDTIRATWLPVFSRFVLADQSAEIKIVARGFLPDGGGVVTFNSPIKRSLRSIQCVRPGKICKVRGLAYVCKVSPSIASRMIEGAKKMLHGYIADVYVTVDQRKGAQGGRSPGFGIFLTAETTEGTFHHGEAMSVPRDSESDQAIPEEIGDQAARRLLDEIYNGGCVDSSAQALTATFMALCDKDASRLLLGPLTVCAVHTLRNLQLFFEHVFKLDEWWKVEKEVNGERGKLSTGSDDKCMLTCVGIGYYNINKAQL